MCYVKPRAMRFVPVRTPEQMSTGYVSNDGKELMNPVNSYSTPRDDNSKKYT